MKSIKQSSGIHILVTGIIIIFIGITPGKEKPYADNEEIQKYGIYSNMQIVNGEYSGLEFIVIPGNATDYLLFQIAEGWPQKPVLLEVNLGSSRTGMNNKISFNHPQWGPFEGEINGDSLAGEFTQAKWRVTLPRGQSIWQKE